MIPNILWVVVVVLLLCFASWNDIVYVFGMWVKLWWMGVICVIFKRGNSTQKRNILITVAILTLFLNRGVLVFSQLNGINGEATNSDDVSRENKNDENKRKYKEAETTKFRVNNRDVEGNKGVVHTGPKICYDHMAGHCARPNCKFMHTNPTPSQIIKDIEVDPFKDGKTTRVRYYIRSDDFKKQNRLDKLKELTNLLGHMAMWLAMFITLTYDELEFIAEAILTFLNYIEEYYKRSYKYIQTFLHGRSTTTGESITIINHRMVVNIPELGDQNLLVDGDFSGYRDITVYPALLRWYRKEHVSLVPNAHTIRTLLHTSKDKYDDMPQEIVWNTAMYYEQQCYFRELTTGVNKAYSSVPKY